MSEKFIANRNLYHTFSRIAIQEGQSIAAAVNKTGHTVTTNDIWTDVDKLPKNTTYFGKANAAFDDLKVVFDGNPEYANYVTLCEGTLTPVDGSGQDAGKNQAWQLLIDGKRVTNFIAPTDVLDNDGKPCNGYTLQLFDKTNTQIDAAAGNWMFDYLAGLVIFERGKTPQDMKWAGTVYDEYIKMKAWRYTGGFLNTKVEDLDTKLENLDTKLEDLDDAIASSDNFGNHSIEIQKIDTTEGYASSYQLFVDKVAQGVAINIPKDQFLKDAEIVEGTYVDGVFTASEDGNKYIHFTFEIKVKDAALAETTQEKHIYLNIQDLCDIYTGGKGITVTADNKIEADIADGLKFTDDTDDAKIAVKANTEKAIIVDADGVAVKANTAKAIEVSADGVAVKANTEKAIEVDGDGVAVKVDGQTIVFTNDGALHAVIPEVPVKSVSGGVGITETSTTGDVVLNLDVATSDEIGGVKSGGDISVAADTGIVSVLSARFADVAGKVENALTAFGKAYDGSEAVTVSGQTGTEKYITYSQAEGVFTVGAQGLDVATNGNYVLSGNTVAANLTALDTAVANLINDCVIKITSDSVTMADEALSALLISGEVVSGVVTIEFKREVLEIGQREAAKGGAFSEKFEDVYPDEEFNADAEDPITTLSADFGDYLDNKDVQWRITYRG